MEKLLTLSAEAAAAAAFTFSAAIAAATDAAVAASGALPAADTERLGEFVKLENILTMCICACVCALGRATKCHVGITSQNEHFFSKNIFVFQVLLLLLLLLVIN